MQLLYSSHQPIGPQPYPVIYIRGCQSGTWSQTGTESPYLQHRVATLLLQHGRRNQNHPTRNSFRKSTLLVSCCGAWLWSWLAAVVNLFVLNLICFVGRAALIFPSPPNNSSDLFIGLMRMRGNRSFTYVSVRCSLVVAVDAGREGSGLRGEEYFRLPLYTRNGQVGEHVQRRKKKDLAPSRARGSTGPFLGGVLTQRVSTQPLELFIPRLSRCTTQWFVSSSEHLYVDERLKTPAPVYMHTQILCAHILNVETTKTGNIGCRNKSSTRC